MRVPAAEVVCDAEYALARDVLALDGDRVVINGPAKSDALLARAAGDGALVMCDSARTRSTGLRRRVSVASDCVSASRGGVWGGEPVRDPP